MHFFTLICQDLIPSPLSIPECSWTPETTARFEELCELKVKVVEERNEIVMQTEEERIR